MGKGSDLPSCSLNISFIRDFNGVLTIVQLALSLAIFIYLYDHYGNNCPPTETYHYIFFLAFAYAVLNMFLLISGFLSPAGTMSGTFFLFLTLLFGGGLFLAAGIALFSKESDTKQRNINASLAIVQGIIQFLHIFLIYKR